VQSKFYALIIFFSISFESIGKTTLVPSVDIAKQSAN